MIISQVQELERWLFSEEGNDLPGLATLTGHFLIKIHRLNGMAVRLDFLALKGFPVFIRANPRSRRKKELLDEPLRFFSARFIFTTEVFN